MARNGAWVEEMLSTGKWRISCKNFPAMGPVLVLPVASRRRPVAMIRETLTEGPVVPNRDHGNDNRLVAPRHGSVTDRTETTSSETPDHQLPLGPRVAAMVIRTEVMDRHPGVTRLPGSSSSSISSLLPLPLPLRTTDTAPILAMPLSKPKALSSLRISALFFNSTVPVLLLVCLRLHLTPTHRLRRQTRTHLLRPLQLLGSLRPLPAWTVMPRLDRPRPRSPLRAEPSCTAGIWARQRDEADMLWLREGLAQIYSGWKSLCMRSPPMVMVGDSFGLILCSPSPWPVCHALNSSL